MGDLKIPMKITATDMVKGRLKIFDSKLLMPCSVFSFSWHYSPEIDNRPLVMRDFKSFPTDLLQGHCREL
jgi:NTE family protein